MPASGASTPSSIAPRSCAQQSPCRVELTFDELLSEVREHIHVTRTVQTLGFRQPDMGHSNRNAQRHKFHASLRRHARDRRPAASDILSPVDLIVSNQRVPKLTANGVATMRRATTSRDVSGIEPVTSFWARERKPVLRAVIAPGVFNRPRVEPPGGHAASLSAGHRLRTGCPGL